MLEDIKQILPNIIQIRQQIHKHPELKYFEQKTAKLIVEQLRVYGYQQIKTGIGKTGVTAVLDSQYPGKTIALRADMDALPIQELTGLPYQSVNQGIMHACGHDGHVATLLGVARLLIQYKDSFKGKIKFIFQPAEEGGAGAAAMINDGVLDNPKVNAIFGYHNMPNLGINKIYSRAGCMMAGIDVFQIKVFGKGGHAAQPEQTIDPIYISSIIIQALQGIISRNQPALEPAIVSVTQINSGTTINIIPHQTTFSGSIRTTTITNRKLVLERFKQFITEIAYAYGAKVEINIDNISLPTINSEAEHKFVLSTATKHFGEDVAFELQQPFMISEDFSYYLQKIPGCFYFLGTGNPDTQLHSADYDFNDAILPRAIAMLSNIAVDYLNTD